MKTLCLETSTRTCSVALADGYEVVAIRESHGAYNHAEKLAVFIDEVLEEAAISAHQIQLVAVSKGPGSYTGLRIGVSLAKGFCYGSGAQLVGIDSLASMASGFAESRSTEDSILIPMIDARRMEVYTAHFDGQGNRETETQALILTQDIVAEWLTGRTVYLFGDGAGKAAGLVQHEQLIYADDFHPSAKWLIKPALKRHQEKDFEDLALFEPYYLKDFVAGGGKS